MLVKRIEGCIAVLGAPSDWNEQAGGKCVGLPIRIEEHGDLRYMVSAWEPTPEELARLNQGAPVHLYVCSPSHPVVALEVGAAAKPIIAL